MEVGCRSDEASTAFTSDETWLRDMVTRHAWSACCDDVEIVLVMMADVVLVGMLMCYTNSDDTPYVNGCGWKVFTSTPGKDIIVFGKRRGLCRLALETGEARESRHCDDCANLVFGKLLNASCSVIMQIWPKR